MPHICCAVRSELDSVNSPDGELNKSYSATLNDGETEGKQMEVSSNKERGVWAEVTTSGLEGSLWSLLPGNPKPQTGDENILSGKELETFKTTN